jgi:hypothetical protein
MDATIANRPQTLPAWMRQSRRGVDWGILLVLALSAAAAWAFLLQGGLPRTNASENYVFRTADYAESILEGRLYPRWSPNVFGGYGAPITHYLPPGAPYVAAIIQILLTDNPVDAVRVLYALSLTLAGCMMYVLVTRHAGAAAGVVAAALYVYSPYVGLTAPHILGDLLAVMTCALVPALLWSINRLLALNRLQDFPLVAGTTAALMLTDLRYAGVGGALALVYLLWHGRQGTAAHRLVYAALGCLVGVLLSSFYWFPALLELGDIHWRAAFSTMERRVDIAQLFAPLRQVDLAEMVVTPQFTLGIPQCIVLLFGILSLVLDRAQTGFYWMFLALGVVLVLILGAFPTQVWLLGVITLCLAIGSSAIIRLRVRVPNRWQRLALPVFIILLLATSSSVWLSPSWNESFGDTSSNAQVEYERQGFGVAIIPPNMAIPATIPDTLSPNRFLLEGYQFGVISKIFPDQVTATMQAGTLAHFSHVDLIQITTTLPTTLEILTAYFPGWSATVDGVPVGIAPQANTGLIEVAIPQTSTSELRVALEATPVRTTAWMISWGAVITVVLIGWRKFGQEDRLFNELKLLSTQEARLTAVVIGCFVGVLVLFALPSSPVSLRSPAGHALRDTVLMRNLTDVGIQTIGYRLTRDHYQVGETASVDIFWRTARALPENYQVRGFLVPVYDPRLRVNETDFQHPGGYPTRRWLPNRYISDVYRFTLSPRLIPGDYQIALEVYRCVPTCSEGTPITFFDNDGNLLGFTFTLPTLITISS